MARKIVPTTLPDSPVIRTAGDVGRHVRAKRTRDGLRIDDAAALCGVQASMLSALENASRSVGLDKALEVLNGLGFAVLIAPKPEAERWLRLAATAEHANDE